MRAFRFPSQSLLISACLLAGTLTGCGSEEKPAAEPAPATTTEPTPVPKTKKGVAPRTPDEIPKPLQ